jgi:hypothetical protein
MMHRLFRLGLKQFLYHFFLGLIRISVLILIITILRLSRIRLWICSPIMPYLLTNRPTFRCILSSSPRVFLSTKYFLLGLKLFLHHFFLGLICISLAISVMINYLSVYRIRLLICSVISEYHIVDCRLQRPSLSARICKFTPIRKIYCGSDSYRHNEQSFFRKLH